MVRLILPLAVLLSSLISISAFARQVENCPYALRVSAHFGILKVDEFTDGSFANVSGSQFHGDFIRDLNTRECVLVEGIPTPGTQRFVGIKQDRKGNLLVFVEGYTPSGKLFSIRVALDSRAPVDGTFRGTVYDNSGTGRRPLGEAQVTLQRLSQLGSANP